MGGVAVGGVATNGTAASCTGATDGIVAPVDAEEASVEEAHSARIVSRKLGRPDSLFSGVVMDFYFI